MGSQLANAAVVAGEDVVLADLRRPIIIVCGYCPSAGSNRTRSWITD